MKRIVFAVSLVAAATLALTAFAAAGTKDYTGPSCNNFTGGDGAYTTFGGTEAFVSIQMTTESPTCAKSTYSLYVLSVPAGSQLASQSILGGTSMACPDGAPATTSCVAWTIDMGPAATAPANVCIYATSSNNNSVSDRAPDNDGSCISLALSSGASGGIGGLR
jgi:hypothetical protein